MADLDSALRQRAAEMLQADKQQAIDAATHAANQLSEEAGRLAKLLADPQVKWFLETQVSPLVEAEKERALNIQSKPEEREAGVQRYAIANEILGLLPKLAAEAKQRAQDAFQKIPQ